MAAVSRPYRGEADFVRVRNLLIENYALTEHIHSWWIDRWEVNRYWGYAKEEIAGERPWASRVCLWETGVGKLVGVVNPEYQADFFIQIHPDYRYLEAEMIDWAEAHHQARRPADAESWPLSTFSYEYDDAFAA